MTDKCAHVVVRQLQNVDAFPGKWRMIHYGGLNQAVLL
jgi:hypothetical protein